MNFQFVQSQELKTTISQKVIQAISLLQYTSVEMLTIVEEFACENPLIDVEVNYVSFEDKYKRKVLSGQNTPFGDYYQSAKVSLAEHLYSQVLTNSFTAEERKIFRFLIENINESGYLTIDIDEASKILAVNKTQCEKILQVIHNLEPVGIGARNLQECLLLQLKRTKNLDERLQTILNNHFDDFANKRWRKIAKQLNLSLKSIQEFFDFVQTLNPRPGICWSNNKENYIIPDVKINYQNQKWNVILTDKQLYSIKMNETYYNNLMNTTDEEVKHYTHQKLMEYRWLVKSIDRRMQTILNVVHAIIEKQANLFLNRTKNLQPMTMDEIAKKIGVHESTISRIVKNKYIETPAGVFSFRDLFTTAISTQTDTSNISNENVKLMIKTMIENENSERPLSDQAIVKELETRGIKVARRTVAKYREQMNIPSSSKRRRFV